MTVMWETEGREEKYIINVYDSATMNAENQLIVGSQDLANRICDEGNSSLDKTYLYRSAPVLNESDYSSTTLLELRSVYSVLDGAISVSLDYRSGKKYEFLGEIAAVCYYDKAIEHRFFSPFFVPEVDKIAVIDKYTKILRYLTEQLMSHKISHQDGEKWLAYRLYNEDLSWWGY